MSQKHIIPIFLDGAVQTAAGVGGTGTTAAWNGTSSFIKVPMATSSATLAFSVGDAPIPGTTLVITYTGTGSTAVDITPTKTVYLDTSVDVATINALGESVTMFWNGSGWAYLGSMETSAVG